MNRALISCVQVTFLNYILVLYINSEILLTVYLG